ncbi:hypothetical protein EK904_011205 [Melospiza melodia maxima]|nr:hypothetical protein EK904_011205 [Melospiza melodia maxima]
MLPPCLPKNCHSQNSMREKIGKGMVEAGSESFLTGHSNKLLQPCNLQQTVGWLKSSAAMLGAPVLHRSAATALPPQPQPAEQAQLPAACWHQEPAC